MSYLGGGSIRAIMKRQGNTTVIGLLTFLLLATFGAAAYFVSRAYAAQNSKAIAVKLIEKQRQKTSKLEQIVKRLESEWQVAAAESKNAILQLDQLHSLINDQNQEITAEEFAEAVFSYENNNSSSESEIDNVIGFSMRTCFPAMIIFLAIS